MDPKSKELLNKILEKEIIALNSEDIEFLRARRSYLKKSQLTEYDAIINPKEPEKEEPPLYVAKKDQTSQVEPVKEDAKES